MDDIVRRLNALWIVIYCAMITGAFGLQVFAHEKPCPLCYLQRATMLSVALAAFLNIWNGVSTVHYGMALFSALLGAFIAGRQIALHICPGFPLFGEPVFGISLYTWSFISFTCSIFMTAALLTLYSPSQEKPLEKLPWWGQMATGYLALTIVGNILSVFLDCGWSICLE